MISQTSPITKHLLITGAGVGRTQGIDFLLAATLLPEIAAYAGQVEIETLFTAT